MLLLVVEQRVADAEVGPVAQEVVERRADLEEVVDASLLGHRVARQCP